MSFLAKVNWRTGIILLVIISIAVFALIKQTGLNRKELSGAEKIYKGTLAPLQSGVMTVSQGITSYLRTLLDLNQLKSKNESLQKEIDRLQGQLVEMENLRYDNQRFKDLLKFKDSNLDKFRLEGATIIARSSDNWFSTITIDKGEKDGIRKNMAVISPKGLVGHVTAVTGSSSEVLLIVDPRSAVGSILQNSRAPGVSEGVASVGDRVRMIYIPEDAPVKKGEMVISSGLGGIFPKGLPIGRVIKVEKEAGGLTKRATVETFVKFNYLEEVFVVLKAWEVKEPVKNKENPPIEEQNPPGNQGGGE